MIKYENLDALIHKLKAKFKVKCYRNVPLFTIRNFTKDALNNLTNGKEVLLKQENKGTVQLITKS